MLVGRGSSDSDCSRAATRSAVPGPTPSATIAPSASAQVPARLEVSFHVRSTDLSRPFDGRRPPDAAAMARIRDIVLRRLQAAGFVDPVVTLGGPRYGDRRPAARHGLEAGPDPPRAAWRADHRAACRRTRTARTSTTAGPTGVSEGQPLPADPNLEPLFTGAAITAADPTSDQGGSPAVEFTLDAAASKLFADYTTNHVGELLRDRPRRDRHLDHRRSASRSPAAPGSSPWPLARTPRPGPASSPRSCASVRCPTSSIGRGTGHRRRRRPDRRSRQAVRLARR